MTRFRQQRRWNRTLASVLLCCFSAIIPQSVARAAQTITSPTVTPASIAVNTPTKITIAVKASDPSLITASVNLQQLDPTGKVFNVISSMYDDGTHGDAVAGDGVLTVRLSFNESAPFPVVLRASAAFKGKLTRVFSNTFNLSVVGEAAANVAITSPVNLAYVISSPITVSGTVSESQTKVTVNGVPASSSNGQFTVSLPLLEGPNTITAVATNSESVTSTTSVLVTLDTTPPRVTIDSPFDGFVTASSSITVTGKANDIVVGTVNNQQVQVTINGVPAQVSNRSYQALNVPLSVGNNTITATARDRAGNGATSSITATRIQPTQPRISLVSGNNQTAPVSTALSQPLMVQLLDGAGNPVTAENVVFKVTQNDGLLNGSRVPVTVTSDGSGEARVTWTLGSRSGSNNLVEATAVGFAGPAIFNATGLGGNPTSIVVDAGGDQTGAVGHPLPNPFIAVVTDASHNRLANVPVTFQIKRGGGNINGQQSYTVNTDTDGRASAFLTLGPQDGIENNLVQATFPDNSGLPAAFRATGHAPGNPFATSIRGVVLDNTNSPVPGATIRAYLQNVPALTSSGLPPAATAQSDAQGQFTIQPAPIGFVKLLVDGSTVQKPGKWPNLEYELVTVAGITNSLGMPVYLLPIDTQHQLCVTDTTGGTLTLPQVPGFALTVQPVPRHSRVVQRADA